MLIMNTWVMYKHRRNTWGIYAEQSWNKHMLIAEPLEKLVSLPMHAALGIKYAEQYLMVYALHVFVYSILLKIS